MSEIQEDTDSSSSDDDGMTLYDMLMQIQDNRQNKSMSRSSVSMKRIDKTVNTIPQERTETVITSWSFTLDSETNHDSSSEKNQRNMNIIVQKDAAPSEESSAGGNTPITTDTNASTVLNSNTNESAAAYAAKQSSTSNENVLLTLDDSAVQTKNVDSVANMEPPSLSRSVINIDDEKQRKSSRYFAFHNAMSSIDILNRCICFLMYYHFSFRHFFSLNCISDTVRLEIVQKRKRVVVTSTTLLQIRVHTFRRMLLLLIIYLFIVFMVIFMKYSRKY